MTNKETAKRIVADGHCDNVKCSECPLSRNVPTLEARSDCYTEEGIVSKCVSWLAHLDHVDKFKAGEYVHE